MNILTYDGSNCEPFGSIGNLRAGQTIADEIYRLRLLWFRRSRELGAQSLICKHIVKRVDALKRLL